MHRHGGWLPKERRHENERRPNKERFHCKSKAFALEKHAAPNYKENQMPV
ncbi:hypothetical protein C1H46_023037 [Malus baccata]|uniref:Uncharacterized protein n=1 Tax=Malus baccata TaxID=106549 RepID=A0A540LY44_MALBA|nr:hypothetical protein C1H46_023037 [Malus baccata]